MGVGGVSERKTVRVDPPIPRNNARFFGTINTHLQREIHLQWAQKRDARLHLLGNALGVVR